MYLCLFMTETQVYFYSSGNRLNHLGPNFIRTHIETEIIKLLDFLLTKNLTDVWTMCF